MRWSFRRAHYFAMGDNRDLRSIRRYWGFVPRDNIVGKPLLVYWSYDAPQSDWSMRSYPEWSTIKDLARTFRRRPDGSAVSMLIRGYELQN